MSDFLAKISKEIDEASIDAAKKKKGLDNANDQMLLKYAAMALLQRRIREAQQVHGSEGAYFLDRDTNKPITRDEIARAEREVNDARDEYTHLSTIYSQAASRLNDLQKQREVWLNLGEYEASQRAQRASETPAQRTARERREQYQRDANAVSAAR